MPIIGLDGDVIGVLDVDSDELDDFTEADADGLGAIVKIIERFMRGHTIPAEDK